MHKALCALLLLLPPSATWPITPHPPVLRPYDPPPTPYAKGHRGVDLAAAPGAPVRAPAPAEVVFAGRVAGRGVITLRLHTSGTPPLHTTYEPVRPRVARGDEVTAGEVIGELEPATAHCAVPCLHWGLKRGETYLNPLTLLPGTRPRLLPYLDVPPT
ncbi:M23 family metallopeptidase [Streptomyces roseirectus]|uniref:M23 family metallopeptidase n=1 Tax=Streptomyces roseirectus TaxID=2768066 RepID=A0A7H0IAV3_9ACTN|nr:M23 family metallopeptidase [Streptomyces roseirectus]QNP69919.1 M23 family metallopeptidase [Streptomyces roseirectus]